MKEICSDLWNTGAECGREAFLLSGRTALDYIIRDILQTKKIASALLPSYCCHTMIEPFRRNGIHIRFYDVYAAPAGGLCAEIPPIQENEIFYYLSYFGFSEVQGIDLQRIRSQAAVVIEDKTHSVYLPDSGISDYSYVSYRKWGGFYGIAKAVKASGDFLIPAPETTQAVYCQLRRQAATKKEDYMLRGTGEKAEFLSLFAQAEALLEQDYAGYAPCVQSISQLLSFDFAAAAAKRKANAAVLLDRLQDIGGLRLLYQQQQAADVPLFVPILVEKDRDALRRYLIEQKIYLPVHWPLSGEHTGLSTRAGQLYASELSLVCDQRYGIGDMEKMADLIAAYRKK